MAGIEAEDARAIERAIARVEAATGAEVVAAVVPHADDYPEGPWRAFALAASLAALAVVAGDLLQPAWPSAAALLGQALTILAAGALAALVARRVPICRRWFNADARAQREVRQCAEVMFLTRELFATPGRNAVLILVAAMERRVVVVPDVGYRGRIATDEWRAVVAAMTPALREGRLRAACEQGLAALQQLLLSKGCAPGEAGGRLPDEVVRGSAP